MSRSHLLAVVVLALSAPACGQDPPPAPTGGSDGRDALVLAIESEGFTVQQGAPVPFYLEDCAALPSCYGSNASSPYVLWHLPPPPGGALPDLQGASRCRARRPA